MLEAEHILVDYLALLAERKPGHSRSVAARRLGGPQPPHWLGAGDKARAWVGLTLPVAGCNLLNTAHSL